MLLRDCCVALCLEHATDLFDIVARRPRSTGDALPWIGFNDRFYCRVGNVNWLEYEYGSDRTDTRPRTHNPTTYSRKDAERCAIYCFRG